MKVATITASALTAASASAQLYPGQSNENHSCVIVPDYQSCSPQANPLTVDSCCVETFGGLVLLTQFWDVYTGLESEGQLLPEVNWTIHGLWPDFWYVCISSISFSQLQSLGIFLLELRHASVVLNCRIGRMP